MAAPASFLAARIAVEGCFDCTFVNVVTGVVSSGGIALGPVRSGLGAASGEAVAALASGDSIGLATS